MKRREVIFHIGMPKTATSYLQKNFFPLLELQYLGKHYDSAIDSRKRDREFAKVFSQLFSMQAFTDNSTIYREISGFMAPEGKVLYSNELICGSSRVNFSNAYQNALHLKKISQDAKIIFITRRQDTLIESLYRQAIRGGYSGSIESFINYRKGRFERSVPGKGGWMDIYSLDLYSWSLFYRELFTEERTLILPYEMLKSDKERFLAKISSFMAVDCPKPRSDESTNARDSYAMLNAMRALNICLSKRVQNRINDILFFDRIFSFLNHIAPGREFLSERLAGEILSFCEESNEKLSDLIGEDLARYGYHG